MTQPICGLIWYSRDPYDSHHEAARHLSIGGMLTNTNYNEPG
jgi:hypothetical protein